MMTVARLVMLMLAGVLAGSVGAQRMSEQKERESTAAAAAPHQILTTDGREGQISFDWLPDLSSTDGSAIIRAVGSSGDAIDVRYRMVWSAPGRLLSTRFNKEPGLTVLTQVFRVGDADATVQLRGRAVNGRLTLDLHIDKPVLGKWNVVLVERPGLAAFGIPYDPVPVYHAAAARAFASLFLDWMASDATRIEPDGAVYAPRSDGSRNPARERLVFSVSSRVADVLPSAPARRSRFYRRMAGKTIIDVTPTDRFADIRDKLLALRAAGMSNCSVIIHVWQGLGYDNGLPTVLPANAFLGGEDLLRDIGTIVRTAGCDFALHQNYVDYYPNAEKFDPALVALDEAGKPAASWFNAAVGIGSFLTKPDALLVLARANAPTIKARLGTTASFVDVNSAMTPWGKVDMDARAPDGGKFSAFMRGSRDLFAFMQDTEGGPVLGEGRDHFFWTGAVDGVEAEMRVGFGGDDVRLAPLWVDFDLLRMHPFQHNYGMGFYNRYAPDQSDLRDAMIDEGTRDLYRTQQLAFAHLPYRSGSLWGDIRLYVQEAALAAPVAKIYGDTLVRDVRYRANDRWVPIETALPAGAGRTVRVRYANGLVVTANTGEPTRDDHGVFLPRGGWTARGGGIVARSTEVVNGRQDFLRDRSSTYADPRGLPGNWTPAGDADPDLIDFGTIRTNGQTWLRCAAGSWTIIGFATRGHIDLDVAQSLIRRPTRLAAGGANDIPTSAGSGTSMWRVRLVTGRRYTAAGVCPR